MNNKTYVKRVLGTFHRACLFLVDTVSAVLDRLSSCHASIYSFLIKRHIVLRIAFLILFTTTNIFVVLPSMTWFIAGISGGFIWSPSLSLWQTAWTIWISYYEVLCACGQVAACSTNYGSAYVPTFFRSLLEFPNSRTFHTLFAIYTSLACAYQAGLTLSLAYGLPDYRPVRSITFLFGLLSYVVALWYLGLGDRVDPDAPYGFICLWWLVVTLGYCLAWLARHHRQERLLLATLQCLVGVIVLAYVIYVYYPELYAWAYEQVAVLVGLLQKAYGRIVRWVYTIGRRIGGMLFPRAECGTTSSKPPAGADGPKDPCSIWIRDETKKVLAKRKQGNITSDETVKAIEKIDQHGDGCFKATQLKEQLDERARQDKAKEQAILANAQKESTLDKLCDAAREGFRAASIWMTRGDSDKNQK